MAEPKIPVLQNISFFIISMLIEPYAFAFNGGQRDAKTNVGKSNSIFVKNNLVALGLHLEVGVNHAGENHYLFN